MKIKNIINIKLPVAHSAGNQGASNPARAKQRLIKPARTQKTKKQQRLNRK
jgi:hypothetical protein